MTESQKSYTQGVTTPPLIEECIGDLFDRIATQHQYNLALVVRHQNIRYSYSQLKAEVNRCAKAMLALGICKGDRVGIWSPNNAQWCLSQLATAKIGAILVNINPAYRSHELEYALKQSQCNYLIAADNFKSSDYTAMLQQLLPELGESVSNTLNSEKLPDLKRIITLAELPSRGMMTWNQLMKLSDAISDSQLATQQQCLNCHDAINIQYTSGTTGYPKGATLSHHNILNNGRFVTASQGFSENDRLVIPVPLYHCFGMVMGNLGCISQGATMIYSGEAFDALEVLTAVAEEQATALYGVPTMFIAMLQHEQFKQFDLSSLRTGIMAGASCPVEVMKEVIERMHMGGVQIAYGMTETSPVSTQSSADDSIEKRVSTVGRTQPHLETKLISSDGDIVERGQMGELCTRGYSVMLGYWNNPEASAQSIDNEGWMHTGDLATMDEEGYISIVGRSKDMVIRGGENIYPREIEEFLYSHPSVADVQVTGVPDSTYGEELIAWVIPKEGEEIDEADLRDYCSGKISHFKVPRYFKLTDSFPMTVTGKIQKFRMREISTEELGL